MIAYISISLRQRNSAATELAAIADVLTRFNLEPFVFVDHYQFDPAGEQQMMQQAMQDIDRCVLLLAETSAKGIGVGIEVGYAKAKGKPVVYMRHKDAEHSTTVSGISDFRIFYADADDLKEQLADTIEKLVTRKSGVL